MKVFSAFNVNLCSRNWNCAINVRFIASFRKTFTFSIIRTTMAQQLNIETHKIIHHKSEFTTSNCSVSAEWLSIQFVRFGAAKNHYINGSACSQLSVLFHCEYKTEINNWSAKSSSSIIEAGAPAAAQKKARNENICSSEKVKNRFDSRLGVLFQRSLFKKSTLIYWIFLPALKLFFAIVRGSQGAFSDIASFKLRMTLWIQQSIRLRLAKGFSWGFAYMKMCQACFNRNKCKVSGKLSCI